MASRKRFTKSNISLGLAVAWATFAVLAMFLPGVRSSVPLIFFMSAYALAATHLSEWAGHKAEDKVSKALEGSADYG